MPTITAQSEGSGGFTLIELLVVLSIMSLLTAVAVQTIDSRPDAFGRERASTKIRAAIAAGQQAAIQGNRSVTLDTAALGVDGLSIKPLIGPANNRLTLYPDGSSTGGVIERGSRPLLRIDWLSSATHDAR